MSDSVILPFRGVAPRIDPSAYIAQGVVVIGDVEIGAEASLWPLCVLRGDIGPIRIGARTNIQDNVVIHTGDVAQGGQGTFVGAGATVGHMALLHGCNIGDKCFVGMRATLLDGATMESGSMIGSCALLTQNKTVRSGEMWVGNPARYWRAITPEEKTYFESRADEYATLARAYKEG